MKYSDVEKNIWSSDSFRSALIYSVLNWASDEVEASIKECRPNDKVEFYSISIYVAFEKYKAWKKKVI